MMKDAPDPDDYSTEAITKPADVKGMDEPMTDRRLKESCDVHFAQPPYTGQDRQWSIHQAGIEGQQEHTFWRQRRVRGRRRRGRNVVLCSRDHASQRHRVLSAGSAMGTR